MACASGQIISSIPSSPPGTPMSAMTVRRAVFVITFCASGLQGQSGRSLIGDLPGWPAFGGVGAIQMRPSDDFGQNVGFGYGAEGGGSVGIDRLGMLRIRGDFGAV